ncbi:MAG TPA: hypothetical protein VLA88_03670 [Candidatus Saccharimonadales bacterium]|nr:hypothetical protein [Candidatus Saccharimonadales bacterium]
MPTRSAGFALIELGVVLVIIGSLLFIVVTQTVQSHSQSGNIQRRADVNSILNAVLAYAKDNGGKLPEGVAQQPKLIASTNAESAVNLCHALVPKYLTTIPIDPNNGLAVPVGSKCNEKNARYSSGYMVQATPDNKVLVSAPGADGTDAIFAQN